MNPMHDGTTFSPKTILVYVGIDLMGDGLMKMPFVRALRRAFPDAKITWLAGKGQTSYAHRLRHLVTDLIDEVIEDANIGSNLTELIGQRPLADRSFDLIIDTQRRVLTTLILRRIRHQRFISGTVDFIFSSARPKRPYRKPRSMILQLLDLVSMAKHGRIDGTIDPSGSGIVLPAAVADTVRKIMPDKHRYIGIAPGAGTVDKSWPRERFEEVARYFFAQGFIPAFILGPDETTWQAALQAAVPGAIFPVALADPEIRGTEPLLSIALAHACSVCIANDSGNAHIFSVAGVPLVVLFGPTSPDKFAPPAKDMVLVRAIDFDSQTMNAIPTDAVIKAAEELIARHTAAH